MIYKKGQSLPISSGGTCKVEKYLGAGTQGEVYQVDVKHQKLALKWYFAEWATSSQKENIERLIQEGPPTGRFLWPCDLVSVESGFGYLMSLRESRFADLVSLMKREVEPCFQAICTAGLELSGNFLRLHAKGLCYRDISFGNVFLDPDSGEICICDNDNVTIDDGKVAEIMGTPRFMAPEIVTGEAVPSANTDRFSLAVLLFYIFMMHHPLEGKKELEIRCLNIPVMDKIFGESPVFIFDPNDDSNRPIPGEHDNAIEYWKIYPEFFKGLFINGFTNGLKDPDERIREVEWRKGITRLRDSLVYCAHCGSENFYDQEKLQRKDGHDCWSCGSSIRLPFRIRIEKRVVVLNHDRKLYAHHVEGNYDFTTVVAEVVTHPKNPNIWGLKNVSRSNWVCFLEDGTTRAISPGKSVTLRPDVKINFGSAEGKVAI